MPRAPGRSRGCDARPLHVYATQVGERSTSVYQFMTVASGRARVLRKMTSTIRDAHQGQFTVLPVVHRHARSPDANTASADAGRRLLASSKVKVVPSSRDHLAVPPYHGVPGARMYGSVDQVATVVSPTPPRFPDRRWEVHCFGMSSAGFCLAGRWRTAICGR